MGLLGASAPAAAGAFDLLETTVLTSSASSVTFSGLDAYSDYKHLQIRGVARGTRAQDSDLLLITINGDNSTSYIRHNLFANGSDINANSSIPRTSINIFGGVSGSTSSSEIFASSIVDILDFSNVNKNTTIRALVGLIPGVGASLNFASGLFINTSAVTSVNLSANGDLVTGSRFSLYGVK